MIRAVIITTVAVAALAATGSTAQTAGETRQAMRLAKSLDGLTPGKPMHCINRNQVSYIQTYPDTIVYVAGRNKKWRNDTVGGCQGLKHDDILVSRNLIGSQYCSGDLIETRSRSGGMVTGACSLGEFVPYTK